MRMDAQSAKLIFSIDKMSSIAATASPPGRANSLWRLTCAML